METPKGGPVESWIVSLVIAVIGWIMALLAYFFDRGRQHQKIKDVAKEVRADRERFNKALDKLEGMFFDRNGNPRLMSVEMQRVLCEKSQAPCIVKFGNLEKDETDRLQRDHEIFVQLLKLNSTMVKITTTMGIEIEKEGD